MQSLGNWFGQRARVSLLVGVPLALALAWPATTLAAEVRTGESVQVAADETIADDVYLFGSNVVIQGTVDGDVIAAGSTLTINGHVTGDVIAAGNTVFVAGPVDGSVRAAGSQVTVASAVADDTLLAGTNILLGGTGQVGRDVIATGATINVQAPVGRNVKASGGTLTIGSTVGGSVVAETSDLVLGSGAQVAGPITYVSNHDASVASGARPLGALQRTAPTAAPPNPWQIGPFDTLAFIRGFVGLMALGAVMVLIFPKAAMATAATADRHALASLGLGFALVAGAPLLALIVFGVGLLVGGWWIGIMLLAAYAMLLVFGYLASAGWLGLTVARWAGWHIHPTLSLAVGLLLVGLLYLIPWLGGFVGFAATIFGVGALALSGWAARTPTATVLPTPVETQPVAQLATAA